MNLENLVEQNLIVSHMAGSHAYGMNTATSDVDIRGIFVADPIQIRTPFFPIREVSDEDAEDTKHYELNHFMKLMLGCNPNVIESLWIDESDIITSTPAYDLLRSYRDEFLSSKIYFTTTGYAHSQLNRLLGHSKWLGQQTQGIERIKKLYTEGKCTEEWLRENFNEEFLTFIKPGQTPSSVPTFQDAYFKDVNLNLISNKRPRQIDFVSLVFNFTPDKIFKFDLEHYRDNYRLIPYGGDIYGVYQIDGYQTFDNDYRLNTKYEQNDIQGLGQPHFIVKYNVAEYKTVLEKYNNYWKWKQNRNEKRHELESKYGYDTKHASHLIRLLTMANEVLVTGQLLVKRPDAQLLLDIRNGSLTYDELMKYADSLEQTAKQSYATTKLKRSPDFKLAAKVTIEVQDMVWNSTKP